MAMPAPTRNLSNNAAAPTRATGALGASDTNSAVTKADPTANSSTFATNAASAGGVNTKKIALTALFCAISLVLSFIQIPIFPATPWLMYDPSGIACLLAALAFGPKLGAAVAIISWLPRVFLDPFGAPMGMLSTCMFVIPAALMYAHFGRTRASSLAGMLAGAVLSVIVACAANLVVTPLYTAVSMADVAGMIIPILLPFNALKMLINMVAGQVLLAPCMNVLNSSNAK